MTSDDGTANVDAAALLVLLTERLTVVFSQVRYVVTALILGSDSYERNGLTRYRLSYLGLKLSLTAWKRFCATGQLCLTQCPALRTKCVPNNYYVGAGRLGAGG